MIEWIKKHKKTSILIIFFVFIFITFMPAIINKIYFLKAPFKFLEVEYGVSDILSYYGAVLTFLGTTILGIVAICQNHESQKKTDEVNKLTLELQQKSMRMAEESYKKQNNDELNKNTPKFELKTTGINGRYSSLGSKLTNTSNVSASGIKSIFFTVFDETGQVISTPSKVRLNDTSLAPSQEMDINFSNILSKLGAEGIIIVWEFQCEDVYGHIHYYRAILYTKNARKFIEDLWIVEKVG